MDKLDIKAKVEELVKKIGADEDLQKKFKADPVKAVEGLLGIDLPDDVLQKIVAGVKAKLGSGGIAGILGSLGDILGKKE